MKAVMYGAGNIGRGFIGQVFARSGCELTFIDVVEPVVNALNRDRRYPVRILSEAGCQDQWVEGVGAIDGRDTEAAARAIAEADIAATAVGVRALPLIAPVIAAGLSRRFAAIGNQSIKPLNIIICENLIDADAVLERLIKEHLSEDDRKMFDKNTGLVRASIGRMVPVQTAEMQDGNPLRVCVEPYDTLPVEKAAFRGEIPSLTGMYPADNFDFYIKRKLFIHNLGHTICAYLGLIRGDTFIYETAGHGGILYIAQNAMLESALALSSQYGESFTDLHSHIRDLLKRFSNKALGDTCARVGLDTARKLGNKDRFIGALQCCAETGVAPVFIAAGTAAALFFYLKETNASQNREAALAVLKEVSALAGASPETEKILLFHSIFVSSIPSGNFDAIIEGIIQNS